MHAPTHIYIYLFIYIRESKIIRTIGTYFAVGYTAGWAWQNTPRLLLSYNCGAGVTLIVRFCHEFFALNMDTPSFICTKEDQRAVIHFCGVKVYQVSKCIEWCQLHMGTVSCHNGLPVNGARGSKMVAQALCMVKELGAIKHILRWWTKCIVNKGTVLENCVVVKYLPLILKIWNIQCG